MSRIASNKLLATTTHTHTKVGIGEVQHKTITPQISCCLQSGKLQLFSLTLYPDLPAGAVRTGQQGKLFGLVHGVVCAGNDNTIPSSPGVLHLILQVQHHLVHSIHLKA